MPTCLLTLGGDGFVTVSHQLKGCTCFSWVILMSCMGDWMKSLEWKEFYFCSKKRDLLFQLCAAAIACCVSLWLSKRGTTSFLVFSFFLVNVFLDLQKDYYLL